MRVPVTWAKWRWCPMTRLFETQVFCFIIHFSMKTLPVTWHLDLPIPTAFGAASSSPEEQKKLGLNQSINHVDFMVGTRDLHITGITHDGREIPVFVNGNFAF